MKQNGMQGGGHRTQAKKYYFRCYKIDMIFNVYFNKFSNINYDKNFDLMLQFKFPK